MMTPEERFLPTPMAYATPSQIAEAREYARLLTEQPREEWHYRSPMGAMADVVRSATAGAVSGKAAHSERAYNELAAQKLGQAYGGPAPKPPGAPFLPRFPNSPDIPVPEQRTVPREIDAGMPAMAKAASAEGMPPTTPRMPAEARESSGQPPSPAQQQSSQYGLLAGQMPVGLTIKDVAELVRRGMPMERIAALAQMTAPQFQSDPATGMQYAVLPNGRVVPVGQGLPTQGTFESEGMKVPTAWDRDPQTGKPFLKFNIPRSSAPSAGGQPQSPGSQAPGPQAQQGGGRNPGQIPPSGLGPEYDQLRQSLAQQKGYSKSQETAAEKGAEGRVAVWKQAIDSANQSYGVLQDLSVMRDAYTRAPQGGPLAGILHTMRSTIQQVFPESGLSDVTAVNDVIDKINFGMATKIARELTARPTQMEVAAAMRNNPGLSMNNKGSLYMIDLMTQIQSQKQELGAIAASLPESDIWKWPQVEKEYYRTHPLISPYTKQPLHGDGAIIRELQENGGINNPRGGVTAPNAPPKIEELMPDGTTRPIR